MAGLGNCHLGVRQGCARQGVLGITLDWKGGYWDVSVNVRTEEDDVRVTYSHMLSHVKCLISFVSMTYNMTNMITIDLAE